VDGCFWGAAHGSTLRFGGASIPEPHPANYRGIKPPSEPMVEIWNLLGEDPLAELRLFALGASGEEEHFHPAKAPLHGTVEQQLSAALLDQSVREAFDRSHLLGVLDASYDAISASGVLVEIGPTDEAEMSYVGGMVARATVAQAIECLEGVGGIAPICYSWAERDSLVETLAAHIGGTSRSAASDWAKRRIVGIVASKVTDMAVQRRRAITGAGSIFTGDILLYQRDGQDIRNQVANAIRDAEGPVVVIGHSLGGAIALDLLAAADLPVAHLVTVGTPAPIMYELDALRGIRVGDALPSAFPRWTNFYDYRDILSFLAAPVFGAIATDILVDNQMPFPRSHSAYWWNEAMWDALVEVCP
jgi:Alpha/beta hydrolase family